MSERETALKEPCPHCGRTDYRWTQEFRVGLSFDRLEVRCDYCRPLRMDAYYFGFTETGVLAIDRILSAVAQAGKGYHHTESWGEDGLEDMGQFYGGSYVAWIQNAANDAAKAFAALPVEGDAPQVCQWREIATAPKDRWVWFGRPASDCKRKFTISPYRWDESHGMWFSGTGWWGSAESIFTHWCEMREQPPAPPVGPAEGDR